MGTGDIIFGLMKHISILWLCLLSFSEAFSYHITFIAPESVLQKSVSKLAIDDAVELLTQAGVPIVSVNDKNADVWITLPEIPETDPLTSARPDYPVMQVPQRQYEWTGIISGEKYHLKLTAPGAVAVSNAIYGLLQDMFGFQFLHPRETRIPDLSIWPIPIEVQYQSEPRFNKNGFHLHTQHPLELTQALLDESFPGGEARVREYIDWLARNRQNYFEFCLLETINRDKWPAYAARWTKYAHDRGVIPGLDLSLHMKQQVAYKLYRNPHRSFRSKKSQIRRRIDELTTAHWKVFNMEFSQTEFSTGNARKKAILRNFIQEILDEKGIHLTGREHVVKPETMIDKAETKQGAVQEERDNRRGTMIHTVMFYSLNDTLAPVYGNKNLHHMREMLLDAVKERETWYYPESAYWITFDISIPMLLTPYLNARLEDILYCDSLGIEGHLTFSSGWEWGYWLIDWSIANWSWKSSFNYREQQPYPEEYFFRLFNDQNVRDFFLLANDWQNDALKGRNYMEFLTAATVTDELPGKFKLPFQPMPEWSYAWLRNEAPAEFADSVLSTVVPKLEGYAIRYDVLRSKLLLSQLKDPLLKEIVDGMDMVALRARHRSNVLRFLSFYRLANLQKDDKMLQDAERHLDSAATVRLKALEIVKQREPGYRYPVKELTSKYPEKTAYHFGYLYPVHNLHFWSRDEEQARQNKWHPFFMNIWPMLRIIGVTEN